MKKNKNYALKIISILLLGLSFVACKHKESLDRVAVATMVNDEVQPLFDTDDLKKNLIADGFYTKVEDIQLGHFYNPEQNEEEAFLNIVGKENNTDELMALVANLVKDNDSLYIVITDSSLFFTHKCEGVNCDKCGFEQDEWGRIIGCKACPKDEFVENQESTNCNHSISTGTEWNVEKLASIINKSK